MDERVQSTATFVMVGLISFSIASRWSSSV